MNRVLTCVGSYAKTPYYIDKIFVNVYCIEELSYVLYENAFLIDRDIVDRKLAVWIEKELNLLELAKELHPLINSGCTAAAFVGTILAYSGYYSDDEVSHAESILRTNVSMNVFERRKARADFLVESKHFVLAFQEYDKLLEILPEEETELESKIYNNKGIAYMNMFLYELATECFMKAHELTGNEIYYKHYLVVKRMSLPEKEYIKMIADSEMSYKLSISLETEMEEIRKEFDCTDEAEKLRNINALKDGTDISSYYDEMQKLSEKLKDEYREFVFDNTKQSDGAQNI